MTGNRLENDIIRLFNRDITLLLSINQIAKKLKKAYPHINSKVNELLKDGVLNKIEAGRSYLCSINTASQKAVALLMLDEAEKKDSFIRKQREHELAFESINAIRKIFKLHAAMISNGKLFFILDHIYDGEAIKAAFPELRKFSPMFFSKETFAERLLQDKSLIGDRIVLYGAERYFEIIDGLRGQLFARYSMGDGR